ncbi:MAG TPA: TIM barrel protein [Saprospiraceae bacterium]|nr:TIM barrel protein [Saprospiraceae bacterium]
MKRREVIKNTVLSGGALGLMSLTTTSCKTKQVASSVSDPLQLKGNINHSVSKWCYGSISLEDLADYAKGLGMKAIELLSENDWDPVIKKGLAVGICNGSELGIPRGFNDIQYHEKLQKDYYNLIPKAADKGVEQIICFSGNRGTISDQIGLEHCAKGLDPVIKMAEKYKVRIVMELLNSKYDHKDYMCDRTHWGAALAEKIGSPNFGLLYDIYHMQLMEGDVINTIKKFSKYIHHYHTGGVPGRREINETQELNYPAIMKAIVATGFKGFVGQEFIPSRTNPLDSLKESIMICDV